MSARKRRDGVAAGVVAVVILFQWCAAVGVFEGQKLSDPMLYGSDGFFTAAGVAAGMRGDWLPFASKRVLSLGAPFVASWNDFPTSDDWVNFIVGSMARRLGVFGAINVAYALACVLAGLSLFFVARRFHRSRPFAAMAGILFGLSGYAVVRGTMHLGLVMYAILPLHLMTASWLASRRGIPFRSPKLAITLAVGVLTGFSFIYYVFFALQLYALALVVRLCKPKRLQPLLVSLTLVGVTSLSLISMNLDTITFVMANSINRSVLDRAQTDVEQYALKPISLLVPGPHHRWKSFRILAGRAAEQSLVQGEVPAPYLGLMQNVMLVALAVAAVRALAQRRVSPPLTWALLVGYLIIAHGVGGGSSVLGLAHMRLFRSVNRVSILILAIVLLFAAWALPRLLARFKERWQWAVAMVLAVFGTYEPMPQTMTRENIARMHLLAESDRALVARAEEVLPAGSAVFELPAMDFPEASNIANLEGYELFRPYFFAKTLRFSHGDISGRPASKWKFQVASLPPKAMLEALRQNGFSGVYVNFKAYPGQEAQITDAFVAAGAKVIATASAGDSQFLSLE